MTHLRKGSRYARMTEEERRTTKEAMLRWYHAGYTVREIARVFGWSNGMTHKLLQEAGVEFRGRGKRGQKMPFALPRP